MTSSKNNNNKIRDTNPLTNNIGLNDPNGLNDNPLTGKPYQNIYANELVGGRPGTYVNVAKIWTGKRVYANKDKIIQTILDNQIILATAGTGVGKTILIPRIALHAFNYKEKIVCTVPKRLPTKQNAEFIATCMDVRIGEHVGYAYQGTNMTNKNGIQSKLVLTTTGSIISRLTGNDPLLSDTKCLIVDEAHERSVETDQLLLLLKKLCLKRPDIKIIIMSATIDLDKFRDYFPRPKYKFGEVDAGSELTHPVEEYWLKRPEDWRAEAVNITMKLLRKTADGDIMIFVKAGGDANYICSGLAQAMAKFRKEQEQAHAHSHASKSKSTRRLENIINPFCIKLEGSSSKEDQRLATDEHAYKSQKDEQGRPYTRKVVVTTNVAESSITVDGIVYIIDSGYEFAEGYEPNSRVRSLLEANIAQSASIQRKGRAGRTRPGVCIYLYSKKDFESFEKYPAPAIERKDITTNILDLMRIPEADTVKKLGNFLDEFISPPHQKFIDDAVKTLAALGAITDMSDQAKITEMGNLICKFRKIKPTFARSIIASHFYGCSRAVCDIVALATVADGMLDKIFMEPHLDKSKPLEWRIQQVKKYNAIIKSYAHPMGDYLSMLKAYRKYLEVANKYSSRKTKKKTSKNNKTNQEDDDFLDFLEDTVVEKPIAAAENYNIKKWCKDNYLNAKKLAEVKNVSKQLYQTLQKAIRPRQNNYSNIILHKGTKKHISIKEIEKRSIDDIDSVMDEVDPNFDVNLVNTSHHKGKTLKNKHSQSGGFMRQIKKEEQLMKLEPNVRRFATEDENIMMAMAIGGFVNTAVKTPKQKDVYVSCFAKTKVFTKINNDSFLKTTPDIVMFDEIFMFSDNSRFQKLNMVNKIPDNIWQRIKENYKGYIKYCL